MKKEQYKQELLRQIAERRDNKLKEKKMALKVAGASDPEKEPGRIKRFGAELEQTDSLKKDVPHKPDMEYAEEVLNTNPKRDKPFEDSKQSPSPGKTFSSKLKQLPERTAPLSVMAVPHPLLPPLDYFNEDLNRAFILRFPGVAPPPLAPIVPNTYMTPYDGAHLYYGSGNYPFHPVKNQNEVTSNVEVQNNTNNDISPKKLPPLNANDCTDSPPSSTESLLVDKSPLRRDNAANYQEALRQQIKERESHKRREKEENEKFQAEMDSFNPWGRGGGGAPIKDQNGNLVSDYYQMHRINAEKKSGAYETEAHFPGSDDLSPQRQLSIKERLRAEQKREIEERKRRQAEERERMRIIEEKEEERLAKERAFIKQNYEEEQRKLKNKETIQPIPQILQEEEVKRKEKQRMRPRTEERKGNTLRVISERGPSPPIPTLQKKQTNPTNSRPSSFTPNTLLQEQPVPAAQHRPVPEGASLQHSGREEVIRELSALRRLLKTEQKKLEIQMGQTSIQSRRQPTADASEGARRAGAVAQVDKKNHKGLKPAELQRY
ncbi:Centrosome and spindle pole-associated protein 1 [Oryzias melastigma]|uniref:Centrosome and spindle pole-associated protein 1 n=1 Tax=Oryzias melastigma TaxID=30732 RepID=A0A834FAQ6_ORYME|nr:Centrosome and spindle pole-associated protein 1 [Oryzias melastigma]